MFALMAALLMGGCTVYPGPGYLPYHSHQGGRAHSQYTLPLQKDVRIKVKEDEQGLVSFVVKESGIGQGGLEWILGRVSELKARCAAGGTMRRYEIASSESSTQNTRWIRGDISVTIEYHCNRNKPGKVRRNQGEGDWL
jgi:hypothetical protein